jgi:hypothetical protein
LKEIKSRAAQNAKALGFTDLEWKKRRSAEHPIVADILMAVEPKLSQIWDTFPAPSRPHRLARIGDLILELQDARRARDGARLHRSELAAGRRARRSGFMPDAGWRSSPSNGPAICRSGSRLEAAAPRRPMWN